MKKLLLSAAFIAASFTSIAQVGVGTTTPDASAALEVKSTSKGLLLPRLTTAQRDAIVSPVAGLAVYCIDCGSGEISFFNGAIWSGSPVTTVPGAPGIGTATPGNTQATVAYTAPADTGGSVITTYTATASPGGFTGTVTQAGSGAIIVTGLTNGTGYTFTVTATNAIGTGTASAASNSVTPVITNVTSTTGRIWMNRNLGATQVATSSTDAASYGDLYQWGRASDGHQSRTSTTTATTVTSATAGHGNFITAGAGAGTDFNWTNYGSEDTLWQSGLNDPCPAGYRIPTETELDNERLEWSGPNYATDAYNSALKLPLAGLRNYSNGAIYSVGSNGRYWSSTVNSTNARYLSFSSVAAGMSNGNRAYGNSVRCIKD
jgi:hypothetical protein